MEMDSKQKVSLSYVMGVSESTENTPLAYVCVPEHSSCEGTERLTDSIVKRNLQIRFRGIHVSCGCN